MVMLEFLVSYVSFQSHYDSFMSVVPVFNVLKDGASQGEKDWLLTNILQDQVLFRIIPCVSFILLVPRWPLAEWHSKHVSNGEYVVQSVLSAHRVPELSTFLLLALRKNFVLI